MSVKTKRAISELTGLLAQPDNDELSMRVLLASFSAAACTQAVMKAQASAAAIQDLTSLLSEFPRDQWDEIRSQAEASVVRTSSAVNCEARLAAVGEVWARVMRQVGSTVQGLAQPLSP